MYNFKDLDNMSEEEILKLPLCKLSLSLEDLIHRELIDNLYLELDKKGLKFRPSFWLSDDWFCPDGITGIAIPFFLAHPKLMALEKKMIGHCEGESPKEFMKLLRHECGHAIENAFFIRECEKRTSLFGDTNIPYPKHYSSKAYSKRFVTHLEDNYAQSHPDEDFAETFAVWLTPRSGWRKKYEGWPALKKLQYVDQKMKSLRGEECNILCNIPQEPIDELAFTIGDYYRSKKRKYAKRNASRVSINHLQKYLENSKSKNSSLLLEQDLLKYNKDLLRSVSKKLNLRQYVVNSALKDLKVVSKARGLRHRPKSLESIVKAHTLLFIEKGKHRTTM